MGFDLGGLLFGSQGDPNRNQWKDGGYIRNTAQAGIANAQNRQAPQTGAANVNTTMADQFRQQQMGLAGQLQGVASGQQAGAGELAAQRQGQRALSNAAGAATMSRGYGAAGARAAARGAGAIGLQNAGMAQQAAMGDQSNARQLLAGVIGQGREQDLGTAQANAGAQNQVNLANMQSRLQTMGYNDQQIQAMLAQMSQMNMSEQAARAGDNGIIGSLISGGAQILSAPK